MGSMNTNRPVIATGNIAVSTFVKMDTSRDYGCKQAGVGDKPLGISQAGTRTPGNLDQALFGTTITNYAAIANESLQVFSEGDVCGLTAGASGWTAGDFLMPDANGNGQTWTSGGHWYGARALSAANSGEIGEVEVVIGFG